MLSFIFLTVSFWHHKKHYFARNFAYHLCSHLFFCPFLFDTIKNTISLAISLTIRLPFLLSFFFILSQIGFHSLNTISAHNSAYNSLTIYALIFFKIGFISDCLFDTIKSKIFKKILILLFLISNFETFLIFNR